MQVLYQLSYGPMSTWWLQIRRRRLKAYTSGASNLPPYGNQATLHLHLFGGKLNRLISGVGSFENHRRPLAMEMLERGAAASHQSTHHRAVTQPLRILHRLHQHHITIGFK